MIAGGVCRRGPDLGAEEGRGSVATGGGRTGAGPPVDLRAPGPPPPHGTRPPTPRVHSRRGPAAAVVCFLVPEGGGITFERRSVLLSVQGVGVGWGSVWGRGALASAPGRTARSGPGVRREVGRGGGPRHSFEGALVGAEDGSEVGLGLGLEAWAGGLGAPLGREGTVAASGAKRVRGVEGGTSSGAEGGGRS